ncbi:alpha/beta fold hydrolase [Reyranella sp.]|uniref:alpha/beta fold hydrolase n=1 Tax=Reyranella sp. TaxID=1929291 RepID=UPI003BAC9E41
MGRHWPAALLVCLGVLAGGALWAYAPSLPPEFLRHRYADPHSTFVDVGGVEAHIRDEGNPDGIPVVLIHGAGGSLHVWDGWVRALGDKARIISVDLPGHGLTGPWPRDEYTVEAYTDFIEVLVDALHLDRFVVVGHSMGGAVAWSFAATRPDRVSQLVLVDSSGYPREGPPPLRSTLTGLPLLGDLALYFKPEAVVRRALRSTYADPATATPERVRRYAELQRFPGNREAALQRSRHAAPLDPTPLKRLNVPTLILWGARDPWVPVADAFRFQNDIKGSQLEVFEALGHNPMEEDPAATAAAVAAFLKPIPPRPAPAEPAPDPSVQPSVLPEKD